MIDYENQLDTVVTNSWEIWTKNGLGLDADDRVQTEKSVADAANNSWQPELTTKQWIDATLSRLGHKTAA